MGIKNFFSNDFHTSDYEKDDRLLTHYYRNDFKSTKETILNIAKKNNFDIDDVNDRYKEILISSQTSEMTLTIMAVNYYEMAIDIHIITHYLISMGRGIGQIDDFFSELDRNLNLIGKGARK